MSFIQSHATNVRARPSEAKSSRSRFHFIRLLPYALLFVGFGVAVLQIVVHSWITETTFIAPSLRPAPAGVVGKTLWGGVPPEALHPPRIFPDNDCYYWISYCRQMLATGTWRVRHTDNDNAPFGREVHWDSGFAWWVLLLTKIETVARGGEMSANVESASRYANPILFTIVLGLVAVLLARRINPLPAAVFLLLLASNSSILWDYGYAHPDHHGMHDTAAAGLILCVICGGAGWVRREQSGAHALTNWLSPLPYRAARRWFRAAGVCAGVGLWIGATQQVFIVATVGFAGLATAIIQLFRTAENDDAEWSPTLWRTWGLWGFGTSVFLYVLEYFPSHLGMRLEVNHPLYALAVLGGGESVLRVARLRQPDGKRQAILLCLALCGPLTLAAALIFGARDWHAWHDPYVRRMHDYIVEFRPLGSAAHGPVPWYQYLVVNNGLHLLLLAALPYIFRPATSPRLRSLLLVALFPALAAGSMMLYQQRWASFFNAALICLALVIVCAVYRGAASQPIGTPSRRRTIVAAAVGVLIVAPSVLLYWDAAHGQMTSGEEVDPTLAQAAAARDVAFALKRYARGQTARVMSGPDSTPSLMYFGDAHGTAALYWEDGQGVHDAADFFSDVGDGLTGDADAARIAKLRDLDFVVSESDDFLSDYMTHIKFGSSDADAMVKSLAHRLSVNTGTVPAWLEPLPFYASPAASTFGMRIYRVDKTELARELGK